jgi:dTDP-4-amino-4,6-dideoxygalactose transaminase
MMNKIPFALPDICQEEIDEVVHTLKNGWLTYGPKTIAFEEEFRKYIGCSHAISVNSATSGLHLALLALGIGIGDEVVVPVNTYTSTANAILYVGATPLFCDIDPRTFNIDTEKLKEIIKADNQKKIKAVMAVHVAGQAADLNPIFELRKQFGFYVVEDAAHALPATYNNKMIGTIGDITVFSFYPTKTLGTCEGGMVCTENAAWAKKIELLMHNGIDRDAWKRKTSDGKMSWLYDVEELGFKYNMNDVAASIAIQQLRKADKFLERRKTIASFYDDKLKEIPSIQIPFVKNVNDVHSRHLYIIQTSNRDELATRLFKKGIMTSVHFKPLHLHSFWKEHYDLKSTDFPNAENVFHNVLSLPLYTKLSDSEVERIVKAIQESI